MQNHFELFQLPVAFTIDTDALDKAYRIVQGQTHPDKFAHVSNAEKRVAMQWATRANEAYQVLKDPLRRAAYLCELHGVDVGAESNTAMPVDFLMQQMEWREALDDAKAARDVGQLESLDAALRQARRAIVDVLAAEMDAGDYAQAAGGVRKLMFLHKFGEEIGHAFALLDE